MGVLPMPTLAWVMMLMMKMARGVLWQQAVAHWEAACW